MQEACRQEFARGNQEKLQYGEIKIKEIRRLDQGLPIEPDRFHFIAPDDNNQEDQTLMDLELDTPLEPGETIRLRFEFSLILPQIFEKTGTIDRYFFLSHWYPKIGKLQADGHWNCHQHHPYTVSQSDFGTYRTALTVPEEFIVGATGNLVKQEKNADNTITYIYEEKDIQDFAWAAYPYFNRFSETLHLPGNRTPVTIELLLAPGHTALKDRYLKALKFAMLFYSRHIFPYPYQKLTLVDTPLQAQTNGGMAFPTLISTSVLGVLPDAFKLPELRIIAQFGHQYWSWLIGSDRAHEAWLDEGINSFFLLEILDEYFKDSASYLDSRLIRINAWEVMRMEYTSLPMASPVLQPSWKFLDQSQYSAAVSCKAAIFLRSLKNLTGKEQMYNFLRYYAEKFRYKHPISQDFFETFETFMNQDYSWAFEQYIEGSNDLDHMVFSVSSIHTSNSPDIYRNEVIFLLKGFAFLVNKITDENGLFLFYYQSSAAGGL